MPYSKSWGKKFSETLESGLIEIAFSDVSYKELMDEKGSRISGSGMSFC
jgi:hypothetical protein